MCGVLFIKSHQEVVLESGARIDLNGKGFWGSRKPHKFAYIPKGQKGGGGSVGHQSCGAGGYGIKGNNGYTEEQKQDVSYDEPIPNYRQKSDSEYALSQSDGTSRKEGKTYAIVGSDKDIYVGEGGHTYGKKDLNYLLFKSDHFSNGKATKKGIKTHCQGLGSGGGCNFKIHPRTKKPIKKRGASGGGALKLVCSKLIIYEGAKISKWMV
eukprot:27835_1